MKKIITLFSIAFIAALNFPAMSQWSTNPQENNAIAVLTGDQTIPRVRQCSDGSIYIGYESNETGFYNIRLQKLDPDGNELWAPNGILVFSDSTESYTSDWQLNVDLNDNAIMTFNNLKYGSCNVVANSISTDGTFNWGPHGISITSNLNDNRAPTVICTPAGNSIYAWTVDFSSIRMQKLNELGEKQWGDEGITILSQNRTCCPVLMPVGDDDFIMKYFEDRGDVTFPLRKIFAQRFNSNGMPVWPMPAKISDAGGMASFNTWVSMISDENDGFFIAWDDDRDDNHVESSFVQHISSAGEVLLPNNGVEVSTLSDYNHYAPCLVYPEGSSDIYVFWKENHTTQNQTTEEGIFAQKISASGNRMWGPNGYTLIPNTEFITLLSWGSDNTPNDLLFIFSAGSVENDQAQVMRLDTAGNFIWPCEVLTFSSIPSNKVFPDICKLSNGQWLVAWSDFRNGDGDIYAQTFSLEGTVGPPPTYGNISGHVSLNGGNGETDQVVISAGGYSTTADTSGNYIFSVQTGVYTVTASLAGYYPESVQDVEVVEDQTTTGIDFELTAVPTTGYIEGTVTIAEGDGLVTDVLITTGQLSVHPDSSGYYILETLVGNHAVLATLSGYTPQLREVTVNPGEITSGIDFMMWLIPVTGYLYGKVLIEENMANAESATVNCGTISASPDAAGEYVLELPVGNNLVKCIHPYTLPDSVNITIYPGESTNHDFNLLMRRCNMTVKAHDQFGGNLNDVEVNISGPEGYYTGVIETDSLIFNEVPFGYYTGIAELEDKTSVVSDTVINDDNTYLVFDFIITSTNENELSQFNFIPNPAKISGTLSISLKNNMNGLLAIYDNTGRKLSEVSTYNLDKDYMSVSELFKGLKVKEGLYLVQLLTGHKRITKKLLLIN